SAHRKSRLTAGPHRCSGRVEVFHGGSWSTVCDGDFDQQDAEVVCRDLDCGIPVKVLGSAAFGRGEGQVWTEELQCRGNESDITLCPISSSLKHSNCSHHNDVGLICSGHTEARLVNGSDSCSGRVELQYLSEWGTVCAVGWDMRAADVLCAQLDCGSAVAVVEVDWFVEGSGHIWADVFDCQGNETHLSQCGISSWSRAACSHKHDAGVICNGSSMAFHEGRVRLSGGSECQGEVEIYFRQDWRKVLLDSWSLSEASVLCRQLGCGSVLNYRSSPSTTEHKHMCVTAFSCSGSEAHLGNCSSAQAVNCTSGEHLYITCSGHRKSRLTAGPHRCSGRVEVFHGGSWSTVCDGDFDQQDAEVVCRELDCGIPVKVLGSAAFGRGEGQVWTEELQCRGNESDITLCPLSSSLKHSNCSHHNDVGLICSGHTEARLVNGSDSCSGRVELQYLSEWGTVCAVGWDMRAADVLCAQLDCGSAVAVVEVDWFVEGVATSGLMCLIDHPWRFMRGECGCLEERVSGEVEIYFRQDWRKVLLDSWSLSEASVLCRQLGCGSVLNYRSSPSTTEHKHMCVTAFSCSGSEAHLGNCSSAQAVNCTSGEHLYITCSGHRKSRLTAGPHRCSGRVEVFHGGSWSTVCDGDFDQQDAEVVCRELDCGIPVKVLGSAAFGRGEGQVWTEELQCRGNESDITLCPLSSSLKHSNCSHHNDVGLICSGHTEARLVNGSDSCSGRVELQYLSEWGTVCAVGWDMRAADVLCAQLDCGSAVAVVEVDWFVEGVATSGLMCLIDHPWRFMRGECGCLEERVSGEVEIYFRQDWRKVLLDSWSLSEASVLCRQLGCGSVLNYRGINCTGGPQEHWSLRLSGGKGSCSGRLEVYHNATWGSVCDDQWNISNAQVVCRQLGCGSVLSADRFGPGEGTVWLNRVKCRGDEIHLWDCHHSLKKHTDCSHAGVTCAGQRDVSASTTSTTKSTTITTTTGTILQSSCPPFFYIFMKTLSCGDSLL
ncbi:scavenger receptor cysteine-rich type 1 protein M130-like, partial [Silurus meridionalis]|uniref:scavenger receptor cysteine-rich type 1 protein M130-like n=1 Tax=Silurus meridionalis TaxID=175797 RepID=UPI001EEAC951